MYGMASRRTRFQRVGISPSSPEPTKAAGRAHPRRAVGQMGTSSTREAPPRQKGRLPLLEVENTPAIIEQADSPRSLAPSEDSIIESRLVTASPGPRTTGRFLPRGPDRAKQPPPGRARARAFRDAPRPVRYRRGTRRRPGSRAAAAHPRPRAAEADVRRAITSKPRHHRSGPGTGKDHAREQDHPDPGEEGTPHPARRTNPAERRNA